MVWMGAYYWQVSSLHLLGDRLVALQERLRPSACDQTSVQLEHRKRRSHDRSKMPLQGEDRSCVDPNHDLYVGRIRHRAICVDRLHSSKDRLGDHIGCVMKNDDTRKGSENDVWLARVHDFCMRTRNHAYCYVIDDEMSWIDRSRIGRRSLPWWKEIVT